MCRAREEQLNDREGTGKCFDSCACWTFRILNYIVQIFFSSSDGVFEIFATPNSAHSLSTTLLSACKASAMETRTTARRTRALYVVAEVEYEHVFTLPVGSGHGGGTAKRMCVTSSPRNAGWRTFRSTVCKHTAMTVVRFSKKRYLCETLLTTYRTVLCAAASVERIGCVHVRNLISHLLTLGTKLRYRTVSHVNLGQTLPVDSRTAREPATYSSCESGLGLNLLPLYVDSSYRTKTDWLCIDCLVCRARVAY